MRKLGWLLIPLLIIGFFIPQILSSPFGKDFFNRAFSKKLHANAIIQSLHVSWLGPQRFENIAINSPDMVGHIGELRSDSPLWNLGSIGDDFSIDEGNFTFPAHGNTSLKNVQVRLHNHNLESIGEAIPGGSFTIAGKIYSKNDFDLTFDLKQFPTAALDKLIAEKNWVYPLFGSVLDATGSFVLNQNRGNLILNLVSPNLTTSLKADLDTEFLTLRQPFTASFRLTPDLAANWLSRVNPLFVTGISARKPIALLIEPDGFRFPWRPLDLSLLQIDRATLDMGRIDCQVGPTLANLISLFNTLQRSNQADIWFTPVDFSVRNGQIQTARMDALISSSLHVCTWGNINFIQNNLNMMLGICADTLTHSFGITGLPQNYVLKMELKGSIQSPELDTRSAGAKIAALTAASNIPKLGGGAGAKIFGEAIGAITKAQENQDDVPPAKRPFPWER